MLLFLGGGELTHELKIHQQLNTVVREVALGLFRHCSTQSTPIDCSNTQARNTLAQTSLILQGTRIVISWYAHSSTADPPCALQTSPLEYGLSGGRSRIEPTQGDFQRVCEHQRRLLTVEGFYRHTPILGTLARAFGLSQEEFYAVTIL